MGNIYKTSNATIVPESSLYPVWIIESVDPEVILVRMIREFFLEMGFSSLYPNFRAVRVDTVHPFALLLAEEVLGTKVSANLFPSVTVADSSENEDVTTIGRDATQVVLSHAEIIEMEGQRDAGNLMIADDALTRLKNVSVSTDVVATRGMYRGKHTIDLNIWTDNKDVTSAIYDMLKIFINNNKVELHNLGIDMMESIQGRRSGDINLEFGKILYGANITVPCTIQSGALRVELTSTDVIATIDTTTVRDGYSTIGGY